MKKWYVITGILTFLWLISLGTCSSNSAKVDEYRAELAGVRGELTTVKNNLADTLEDLDAVRAELTQLKATKEINFGNGLRIFDIEKGYYEVRGKIENVSSTPMKKVVVLVAFYNRDGGLDEDWGSVDTHTVRDLFPGEVMDWKVHFGNWTDQDVGIFDVYTIGNR